MLYSNPARQRRLPKHLSENSKRPEPNSSAMVTALQDGIIIWRVIQLLEMRGITLTEEFEALIFVAIFHANFLSELFAFG